MTNKEMDMLQYGRVINIPRAKMTPEEQRREIASKHTLPTHNAPDEHDEEASRIETAIRHENYKLQQRVRILTEFLSEAWTLGATHEQPSFGQLNSWRIAINKKES